MTGEGMTTLHRMAELGQSVWCDNISRAMLERGELAKMVEEGVLGVTSNPTIFDKAISGSADYDAQIKEILARRPNAGGAEIIRALMVRDIQMAADVLGPVYARTSGGDGYVSVEVTPNKARNTDATVLEARELWRQVNRPNVMIKIPATVEGLPAVEQMISEGVNINVTLIFSVERYRDVAEAYCRGLERRIAAGNAVDGVASVASVFVSRVDTLVDDMLSKQADHEKTAAARLLGKAAVANAKMVYRAYQEIFDGPRFSALRTRGAAVQRPLWASTGTKNPAYSDLLYVDTLIGPHTVNTVPPATYAAILDHGQPVRTVDAGLDGARDILAALAKAGIDMKQVTDRLEAEGVLAFEKSFDGLEKNIEAKRTQLAHV
jgi:transaldolase